MVRLSIGRQNLLFAEQDLGPKYSELHMAAGERAILRIAQDVGQMQDALVLIDEVEAGLHPWLQELLMIELQQLALRNNLQVIVTTHSPVVLDTVPANGRIFLDGIGTAAKCRCRPPTGMSSSTPCTGAQTNP